MTVTATGADKATDADATSRETLENFILRVLVLKERYCFLLRSFEEGRA